MTDTRTQKERMLAGDLYNPMDAEIVADQEQTLAWMERFNAPGQTIAQRHALLTELFGGVGAGVNIRAPFHCDYGYNITLGDGVFMNFGCVILDVVSVTIGDRTMIGPHVKIFAADHPRDADTRKTGMEFGRPVVIGKDVWIGAGAKVLAGSNIADGCVIGANSVIKGTTEPFGVYVGSPARLIKRRALPDMTGRDQ